MRCIKLVSVLTGLLLLAGCRTKNAGQSGQQESQSDPVVTLAAESASSDEASRYGVYSLDGGESTEENGNYDSAESDENALLACDEAALCVRNADVNKTGDGTSALSSGLNAAAAAARGAQLTLESCIVTTNAASAPGLFASGEGSVLSADQTQVVTAGAGSPLLICAGGASMRLTGSRLTAESADSPLLMSFGDASVTLSGCTLRLACPYAAEVADGALKLTLDAQALSGDIRLSGTEDAPAALDLSIVNGASFTGGFVSESVHTVRVTLDAASSWTLTGDVTVATLSAPDTTFANIESNGYSIFYNAELEENAWLGSISYKLPGGGYLSPLI